MADIITQATGAENIADALRNAPPLEQWDDDAKRALTAYALLHREALRGIADAEIADIDFDQEKQTFLAQLNSSHTRTLYSEGLADFAVYCARNNVDPRTLTPAQADDYIYSLRATSASAETVRSRVTSASSLYNFLHRRHQAIENPFRGTKARPPRTRKRAFAIPTDAEAERIEGELGALKSDKAEQYALAVYFLRRRGFRVGALASLDVNLETGRFTCLSKGKSWRGELPPELLGLCKTRHPFADFRAESFKTAFERASKKLYSEGKIKAVYSPHDLRHMYAVAEYTRNKDIYSLKQKLNHASIAVTENYLRGLNVID